jgi:acetylornithine/N-succinyldiaminopimelate aminotransferase
MSQTQQWLDRGRKVLIQNYGRLPVVMVRGQGVWVWDAEGKKYLDLFAGFGGAILGHCHPALVEAAMSQASTLWHVGNLFYTTPQIELAETLNRLAFNGQAFFAHSGADANEAACKLARLRGNKLSPKRYKIIALQNSFHGRTLAMIAATGNPKYRQGFEPDTPGFVHVPGGNFEALAAAVDEQTAGVIMEPIQGEGGINVWPADYAAKVRKLCDQRQMTLIFDEVWTGCGRTGKWFGYQHFAGPSKEVIEPDILTLGKAVGGGLPVGIMYAKPHLAQLLGPGKHASTLGANGICMAVSKAVFDVIETEKLVEHARQLGEHALQRLGTDQRIAGKVAQVRGCGLFLGIELRSPPAGLVEKALQHGLIINVTAEKVVRLAPPMNITAQLWDQGLDAVTELIAGL